jgi:hypothetical protein
MEINTKFLNKYKKNKKHKFSNHSNDKEIDYVLILLIIFSFIYSFFLK